MISSEREDGYLQEGDGSGVNDARTCQPIGTRLTQPRSADVLRFKIKVPQTLDQAAKLRKWLEQIAHKTSLPARNFVSNLIYQIKATEDERDLLRPEKQPAMAYQRDRLAGAGPQ